MRTIQQKLTLIIVLTSFFALLVAGLAFVAFDYFKFKETQVKELKVLSEVIGANSTAAIDFNDFETATELLSILRAVPQIQRAALYKPDGSNFASYTREFTDSQWEPPRPEKEGYEFEGQFLSMFSKVKNQNRDIGYLYLHADLAAEKDRWNRYVIILIGMSILALIVAIIMGYKLQHIITKPVMDLAKVASRVSSEKDYKLRVEVQGADEIRQLVHAFNDMLERIAERELERDQAELELTKHRDHLEELVEERTEALQASNSELEAFSYSVSHDLRAPLRSIHGFSQMLLEDYANALDEQGLDYIHRVQSSSLKMTKLIEALLQLSKITRLEFNRAKVNISMLVEEAMAKQQEQYPGRTMEVKIESDVYGECDENLLSVALDNIIGNAWKYTGKTQNPSIEFGVHPSDFGSTIYYVKDNGAGFDMKYAEKVFMAFKRLHGADEYPGTGVGLATVQRIIARHDGKIWTESEENVGTTFFFTLTEEKRDSHSNVSSIFG